MNKYLKKTLKVIKNNRIQKKNNMVLNKIHLKAKTVNLFDFLYVRGNNDETHKCKFWNNIH